MNDATNLGSGSHDSFRVLRCMVLHLNINLKDQNMNSHTGFLGKVQHTTTRREISHDHEMSQNLCGKHNLNLILHLWTL